MNGYYVKIMPLYDGRNTNARINTHGVYINGLKALRKYVFDHTGANIGRARRDYYTGQIAYSAYTDKLEIIAIKTGV